MLQTLGLVEPEKCPARQGKAQNFNELIGAVVATAGLTTQQ